MKLDFVERLISRAFFNLGRMIGRRPRVFIILPLSLTVLLGLGMFRYKYISDPEYLFSPTDGPSKQERVRVETLFPMNYSTDFDAGRITRLTPLIRLFVEAKDNKSIFDKDVFDEIKRVDRVIRNVTLEVNGTVWSYEDLCAKKNKKCFENHILRYEDRLDEMARGRYSIEYPVVIDRRTLDIFFTAAMLGGISVDNRSMVVSAKAATLLYFLDKDKVERDSALEWERLAMDVVAEESRQNLRNVDVGYTASQTIEKELDEVTLAVLPLASITVAGMLVFSITASLMMDWVKSKPWLGFLGCVSAGLSVVAGFGCAILCGVELISLNISAPFLMVGIGMDNTFLLLAAWRRTDRKLSIEERMAGAYADAGVSITITSLTNLISFCIGIMTPFPCVRIFCMYTSLCVVFMYTFQITFFGACMAMTGYAEQKNMHGLLCFRTTPKSLSKTRGLCFRICCSGGINPEDPENVMDNEENLLMKLFRDKLGTALTYKPVQLLTIILFIVYIGFGGWGCTTITEGLERFNMAKYDSYSIPYYRMEDKYFRKYPHRIQIVINKTLDYSDPEVLEQVEEVVQKFENSRYMAGPRFTESWLRIYREFLNDSRIQSFLSGYNMSKKADFYGGIRDVFFRFSKNYFKQDIKFNSDFTEITATRFVVQSENILTVNDEKELLVDLRAIAKDSPLPITVTNYMFVYFDHFVVVRQTAMQSICIATLIMIIVSFIFIPIPVCAMWVAFSIFSIEIGVIGYMSWWNVNLDVVSMISLILCIGFSVDYSAHIAYTYVTAEEDDPDERVKRALHSVGLPILQGSLSTFIGIFMLIFVNSYIPNVFFKTIFLVILFGALHGLFLLPVALRLTDECWRHFRKTKDEHEKPPPPYYTGTVIQEKLHEKKDSWNQFRVKDFNSEMEVNSQSESFEDWANDSETESGIGNDTLNDQISTDNDRNSTDNIRDSTDSDCNCPESVSDSPENVPDSPGNNIENSHVNKAFVGDNENEDNSNLGN